MNQPSDDWTEPGAYEVDSGVYRIPLPLPNDGLRAVNIYAIVTGTSVVCIDAGWSIPEARSVLDRALGSLGATVADIERFLVTHAHRDHYTQAVVLRRETGASVSLGVGERPALELAGRPGLAPLEAQLLQLRSAGANVLAEKIVAYLSGPERMVLSEWEEPDTWLTEVELEVGPHRRLQVVETPGHTRGHVVFHDRAAEILFAGDHVLPRITPSIGFEPVASPDPLGAYLGSLARVRRMPDAVLLPAHGPVAPSVHARIDELIDHHGRRLEATEAAVTAGADTGWAVAGRLGWTRRERNLSELDNFNQMLAVTETMAHLSMLVAQGRLSRRSEGELHRYLPSS